MGKFQAFRAKSDGYLRRMMANPEEPPKLNWAFYKKYVPIPNMVDTFQKQYEALKVPYPADNVSTQIDAQEKECNMAIEKFKIESKKRIAECKAEIERLSGLLPYEQMTMEDYYDAHPEDQIDALNKPTFWPHTPEEQLDYKATDAHASSGH
ncbi:hypothetical protein AAG570_013799 [Ranatra chinensis]|uniref:ATP synthase subunit d, mitochondrial n=1 Tax=Ranatra chinensis TaxID=642074 RepID=A0ABD0YD79_9HEMI